MIPEQRLLDAKREVNVDGYTSADGNIRYFGNAALQPDGTWRCLADVFGSLCVVEVRITGELLSPSDAA